MVSAFTAWHAQHHTIARVVQYELAALTPEHLAEVATIRRAISTQIEQVLADGVRDGSFAVPDLPGTTLAVLSLSIDVARWYTPTAATRRPGQAVRRPRAPDGPGMTKPRT